MPPFVPDLPLETERLRLRGFTPADADALLDLRAREDVVRWLYDDPWDREKAERKVADWADLVELREDAPLLLAAETRDTGVYVGDVMLRLLSAEHRDGEIGYVVHPDHQGRGYATELSRALLRIAFEDAGMHRVIAKCEPRNTGSWRVMERLGMRREAEFRENEWVKGEWQSEFVYALLEHEWRAAAP